MELFALGIGCPSFVLSVTAMFVQVARRTGPLLRLLGQASFGIYLVHYVPVTWIQYGLLRTDVPAIVKALIVLLGQLRSVGASLPC